MNRHTKLALFVAPILILGGYIASDFYLEHKADQARVFPLVPFGHCDVVNEKCILKSGEFEINVMDKAGTTIVNSTFPLDTATLFVVESNDVTAYQLAMPENPYYWERETKINTLAGNKGEKVKLRLIASIKGGDYIAEFYSQTTK